MNTPETDHLERNLGNAAHPVLSSFCRKLERERDEARDAAQKAKAYKRVLKETNAQLKRERDEARGQRDRLAEALEQLMAYQPRSTVITTNERHVWSNAKDALQSLTTNTELTHPESKP